MPNWRSCEASSILGTECTVRWPNRRKPDGTIGDASHAARQSDHNPDANGIVRARDIDVRGIDAPWLAQHLVDLGKTHHPALGVDSYVIFNRLIATANKRWEWRPYGGSDPHTSHIHISFTSTPGLDGYDSHAGWMVADGTPTTPFPQPPAPFRVQPQFNPALVLEHIAAYLVAPFNAGGGTWLVSEDGDIYAFGCPYAGGPGGKTYFTNHRAAGLRLPTPQEIEAAAHEPSPRTLVYVVIDVDGNAYHFPNSAK